jgi:hypothetical protein
MPHFLRGRPTFLRCCLANGVSQLGGTPIEVHGPEIPQAARPDSSNYISAVLEFAATTFQPSANF